MADAKPKGIPMRARLKAQDKIVNQLEQFVKSIPEDSAYAQQVERVKKLFQIEDQK